MSGANNPDAGGNETKPVWSPDGLKIVFHVTNVNSGLDTYRQVAPNGDIATGPIDYTGWKKAVSPDGTKKAHVQDHDLWMRISQSDISIMYSSKKLVYFTQDAESRISFDYLNRINGARKFLNKWKRAIVNSRGLLFYMKFRRNYLFIVGKPIYDYYYKKNKLLAIKVLSNVLLRNGLYYRSLVKQSISAIKKAIRTL